MERGQGRGTVFAPHQLGDVFFPTDDIIIPETLQPGVEDQVLYLPGRDAEAPQRRHRQKAQQPAISMFLFEGGTKIVTRHPEMFEPRHNMMEIRLTAGQ